MNVNNLKNSNMKHKKKLLCTNTPFRKNSNYIEYGYYDLGSTVVITYIKSFKTN